MSTRQQRRQDERRAAKRPPGVVIAWLHPGQVSGRFLDSIFGTLIMDADEGRVLYDGGQLSIQSSPRIAEARCQVVEKFLTSPDFARADWLWMVDSDMSWEPDTLKRMLAIAEGEDIPILGGLCFAGGRSRVYPTIYKMERDADGGLDVGPVDDYERDALIKVGATGAACLLVHRNVFMLMARPHPNGFGTHPDGTPNIFPWFAEGHVDRRGVPYGEDIAFCIRAAALQIPVYVHTGIRIGHEKTWVIDEAEFDGLRKPKSKLVLPQLQAV